MRHAWSLRGWMIVLASCPALAGAACLPAPAGGCLEPAVPASGRLVVTDRTPDDGDLVAWTWARGETTPPEAFGNPLAAVGFSLCLYDGSDAAAVLVFEATAPPGDTCAGAPCWRALAAGRFRYADPARTPDGMDRLVLQSGAAGKARVVAKGKGPNLSHRPLGMPAPPLALPFRVQLQATNGQCWEAVYAAATQKKPGRLTARSSVSAPLPTTTTTTTIPLPASCTAVLPPPGSCAGDVDCPAGYACVASACQGGACTARADCALAGECVFQGADVQGTCVCFGCGAPSCPLGCRKTVFISGCVCTAEGDCPDEDDVCFMGFCS